MRSMVMRMKDKFDKYWGDCNLLISIAAILDPRSKMQLIEWCFPRLYSTSDSIEHIITIRETLGKLYRDYLEAHQAKCVEIEGESDNQNESSNVVMNEQSDVRAEFNSYIRHVESSIQQVKSELDVYLDEGVHLCPNDSKFDVLERWKMNSLNFRVLSKTIYFV